MGDLEAAAMLDAYSRRARLAPIVLVVLTFVPVMAWATAALPGLLKASPVVAIVLGYVAEEAGRARGRALQSDLWASWGGPPTTQLLRWSGADGASVIADRHTSIEIVLGDRLPSADQEGADPAAADARYELAVKKLLALTRGRYPVLLAENASYGFRRNCLGLKPVAQWLSALAFGGGLVMMFAEVPFGRTPALVQCALGAISLTAWTWLVTEDWVRRQAMVFAEELFKEVGGMAIEAQRGQGGR